jgi:hypothetical protein
MRSAVQVLFYLIGFSILSQFSVIEARAITKDPDAYISDCLGEYSSLLVPIYCKKEGFTSKTKSKNLAIKKDRNNLKNLETDFGLLLYRNASGIFIQKIPVNGPGTHIAPAAPIPVKRLQFLPPRIEDEAGFIDESIRFVAQSSEHTLTFSLVCKEKGFAYIGAGVGDKLPEEYFSLCQPMPTIK